MGSSEEGRPSPRISATKLGEYLTATASRRRKIVEDQKYPPPFQVARYTEAEKAIVEFLTTGRDAARLERRKAALVAAVPTMPLGSRVALMSNPRRVRGQTFSANKRVVALVNGFTLRDATRAYSANEDFIWFKGDGPLSHAADARRGMAGGV